MRKLRVGINAEQFIHARDQIHWINRPLFHLLAARIRRADDAATFESAAGDERRENIPSMIASAIPRRFPLHFRRAAKFAAAPDNRAVEQTMLGQILK